MKEDLKELYFKIENYFKFDKANSILITIFKSLLLLVCGGLFGVILKEYSTTGKIKTPEVYFFSIGILIYIYFETIRLSKEKNFPISILQHLTASEQLIEVSKKNERQSKVFDFIDNSIKSLNSNTCPIAFGEASNDLCHQDLNNGLKNVINDLVERTNYFFDVDKSKFTVGVYLDNIRIKDGKQINEVSKGFIFKDDLNIKGYLPEDLIHFNSENDFQFRSLTKFIEAIKFSRFVSEEIQLNNKKLLLICSPIPNVCEDCPPIGLIFTVYEGCENCSTDSENVLLIYGRLLANWISKYEDCLHKNSSLLNKITEHQHKENITVPEEIKHLIEKEKNEQTKN